MEMIILLLLMILLVSYVIKVTIDVLIVIKVKRKSEVYLAINRSLDSGEFWINRQPLIHNLTNMRATVMRITGAAISKKRIRKRIVNSSLSFIVDDYDDVINSKLSMKDMLDEIEKSKNLK